ncbi:MAG: hypothetical protein IH886_08945 [Nitrospinae bacterium]|nr:hypothetical protein [Nitrospinota bacterium]
MGRLIILIPWEVSMSKRGLSGEFFKALKAGILKQILAQVLQDNTLDLQIRKDEVHIYYRGGKILGIKPIQDGKFNFYFDKNYCKTSKNKNLINSLQKKINLVTEVEIWIENIPFIKQIMDYYLTNVSKKDEREFQQLVVRENNYSNISNSTDYFILDIEYDRPEFNAKFDLIAIKWKSTAAQRKQTGVDKYPPRIVFIEKKYADGALNGSAGIIKHIKDIEKFLENGNNLKTLKEEMINVFKQKRELGLIKFGFGANPGTLNKISDEKPELILLLANHDPGSEKLLKELEKLPPSQQIKLKVAISNFMGYGFYDENIYPIDEFRDKFKKQIYSS